MNEINIDGTGHQASPRDLPKRRALWTRNAASGLVYISTSIAFVSLVLLSPLLLRQIGRVHGVNWLLLGNVGQAYGAASAILSGVALIGISLSLILQRRQAKTERIRLVRDRQAQILGIVLDNPEIYAPVIGMGADSTADEMRQQFFATMLVNYARTGYETGVLTDQMLREELFSQSFKQEPMRKWWAASSRYWTDVPKVSRRDRQFVRIMNDEYRKAVVLGQPRIAQIKQWPVSDTPASAGRLHWKVPISLAVGAAVGFILGSGLRGRR